MIERSVPNLYEIVPGLYQSGAPATRNGPAVFEICATGIDTIVNTSGAALAVYRPNMSFIQFPFADCWREPVHDDSHIPHGILELAVFVRSLVSGGHNVLVHCQHGLNRSGLVNAMVLRSFGYSTREAIEMVRRGRGPEALKNTHFTNYLEALDDVRRN